ncbi:MAG: outer membrane lipoprotein-sorting protein [Polyangiaceae bacterium]
MKLRHTLPVFAVAGALGALVAFGPDAAKADSAGDSALATIDAAMNKASTLYFEYKASIKAPDKDAKSLGLTVRLKGDKRLTEFTSPADVKGTKVLILSPTQMYIYLPSFGKVRRIASHTTEQGFMGLNFTQNEMLLTRYTPYYSASITSDDGTNQVLKLTAKEGTDAPYPKVVLTVAKSDNMPRQVDYFEDASSDKASKTETRTNYTCDGGDSSVCTPTEFKMVDHTKSDMYSTLTRSKWKANSDMSDDLFTKRNLEN